MKIIKIFILFFPSVLFLNVFSQAGLLDNTFGINGIVTKTVYPSNEGISMAIRPDDKIIITGGHLNQNRSSLVSYNPDGTIDNTFGINGVVTTTTTTFPREIQLRADGKIVIVGVGFQLVQFVSNGNIDTNFGNNGIASAPLNATYDNAYCTALQSDGKVLIGGETFTNSSQYLALERFNPDGTLDAAFGINGVVTNTLGSCQSLFIQSDGKIVLKCDYGLLRLNANGTIDNSFGNNGLVSNTGKKVLQQSDSKLLAVGNSTAAGYFLVTRLNTDGSVDNTFGTNGQSSILGGTALSAYLQPDGKILVSGNAGGSFTGSVSIARFNTDGSIDNAFGNNGVTFKNFGSKGDYPNSISMQTNGKIIVGGAAYEPGTSSFFLERYLSGLPIGIQENEPGISFKLFPNPANNKIHIDSKGIDLKGKEITITNESGSVVLKQFYSPEININNLSKGIYYLSIEKKINNCFKFVKE